MESKSLGEKEHTFHFERDEVLASVVTSPVKDTVSCLSVLQGTQPWHSVGQKGRKDIRHTH